MSNPDTPVGQKSADELLLSPIEQLSHVVDALCEEPFSETPALQFQLDTCAEVLAFGAKVAQLAELLAKRKPTS
jgi:hypothetical protein